MRIRLLKYHNGMEQGSETEVSGPMGRYLIACNVAEQVHLKQEKKTKTTKELKVDKKTK